MRVAPYRGAAQNHGLFTEALKEQAMHTCLIVIDAQESFRQCSGWNEALATQYLEHQNALIIGAVAQGMPIVRIFHSQGVADLFFARTSHNWGLRITARQSQSQPKSQRLLTLQNGRYFSGCIFDNAEKMPHAARHRSAVR